MAFLELRQSSSVRACGGVGGWWAAGSTMRVRSFPSDVLGCLALVGRQAGRQQAAGRQEGRKAGRQAGSSVVVSVRLARGPALVVVVVVVAAGRRRRWSAWRVESPGSKYRLGVIAGVMHT